MKQMRGDLQIREPAKLADAVAERALNVDTCQSPAKQNKSTRIRVMRINSDRDARMVARQQRVIESIQGGTEGAARPAVASGTHRSVTRPLLHLTPSQPPSQGSLADDQLNGAFVHWLKSELRAAPVKKERFCESREKMVSKARNSILPGFFPRKLNKKEEPKEG